MYVWEGGDSMKKTIGKRKRPKRAISCVRYVPVTPRGFMVWEHISKTANGAWANLTRYRWRYKAEGYRVARVRLSEVDV